MNDNVNKGNSMVKTKKSVWEVKIGIYSPLLILQSKKKTEAKIWKTKVILN